MTASNVLAAELAASLLTHEEQARLAAKLANNITKADRPGVPAVAFAPLCWAAMRLDMAVEHIDRLAEERARREAAEP